MHAYYGTTNPIHTTLSIESHAYTQVRSTRQTQQARIGGPSVEFEASMSSRLPPFLAEQGGGGRAWVLNADGTTTTTMTEEQEQEQGAEGIDAAAMENEAEEEEEEEMASPDMLVGRILHPTAPGPPAPFAGFDVRVDQGCIYMYTVGRL
jgi:hypothetical protein